MRTLSKHLMMALVGTAFMASCSRPVAYFQPTAREQFKLAKTESVVINPEATARPVALEPVKPEAIAAQNATQANQVAQAQQTIGQIDAYVRNDSKLASNKKLTKRMTRVNQLLSATTSATASSVNVASSRKTSFIQRVMLKQVDKKIKHHLAPEKPMAKSLLTIGLIVGIIGLILLLLNVGSPLGLIALIVGLALVLVDLLR